VVEDGRSHRASRCRPLGHRGATWKKQITPGVDLLSDAKEMPKHLIAELTLAGNDVGRVAQTGKCRSREKMVIGALFQRDAHRLQRGRASVLGP